MASYVHRDVQGTAKAVYDGALANQIFQQVEGHFEQKTYVSSGRKTVSVIDRDCTLTRGDLCIFFWQGDVLIPR